MKHVKPQAADIAEIDIVFRNEVLAAFEPPEIVSTADWAEANMVLPADANSEPGALRLTRYQRGIADAFDDKRTEILVAKMASQTGKSLVVDAILMSSVALAGGPMMIVHPTGRRVKDYVLRRLDPLIKATKAVASKIISSALDLKTFVGGSLSFASSFVPDELAAKAIRVLLLDEVDRFARSAGTEGDPVLLAIKRTISFLGRNRKIVIISTPTAKGTSRVEAWFLKGTQERFAIPCPECGCMQVPSFENLKWKPGKPNTAHLQCEECAHPITNRERLKVLDLGEWWAFNPNPEPGIRSFHATELASKFSSLAAVAKQAEDADTPEKKKVFTNTVLAEVFDLNEETFVEPETLQSRAIPMNAPYPKSIRYVVAGADVQRNRIEVLYLAVGESGQRWVIDRRIIPGDTTGAAVWQAFGAELRAVKFPLADGRILPLSATFVDSGYMPSIVYEFCAKGIKCWPTKGRGGWDRPNVVEGKRVSGSFRLKVLGVDNLKLSVAKSLALSDPQAHGFIYLPDHLESEFFEQLTVEKLQTTYKFGYPVHKWTKEADDRNEAFDCLVYATAAASFVKTPAKALNSKQQTPTVAELAAELNALSNAPSSNVYQLRS